MIFNDTSSLSSEEEEEYDDFEMAMGGILNKDFRRMRLGSQSNPLYINRGRIGGMQSL
jgi:hypothetical protein